MYSYNSRMRVACVIVAVLLMFGVASAQDGTGDGRTEKGVLQQAVTVQPEVVLGGKIWAVIIGINYQGHSSLPALQYAENDALRFKDTLIGCSGNMYSEDRTVVLSGEGETAPSRKNILKTIRKFAELAGERDTIVVYFSGHGHSQSGKNYLVPVDVEPGDIEFDAVKLEEMFEQVDKSSAAQKVILLDACHSGAESAASPVGGAMSDSFMTELDQIQRGRFVLSSCDINEVSLETPELGGVFTHFVCEGLNGLANSDGDGVITIAELYGFVSKEITTWCQQNNAAMTPTLVGKLSGNPVLAMLDVPDETFNYVSPVSGASTAEPVRKVTYAEAQNLQAAEEKLVLAKLILFDSKDEASLNTEFITNLERADIDKAISYLDEFQRSFPDSPEGYRYYAQAQWLKVGLDIPRHEQYRFEAAMEERALLPLDKALQLEPDNPANSLLYAQIVLDMEDYERASEYARRALELDADLVYGYVTLGHALTGKGSYGEAIEVLTEGTKRFPRNPHVWKFLADAYLNRGQPSSALEPLKIAEKLYSEVGTGYYTTLAYFYESLGEVYYWTDRDKAKEYFQLALDTILEHAEEEKGNAYFYKYCGQLYHQLDRPAEYRANVMKAFEMDNKDPYVLFDRGAYYLDMGNESYALRDISDAIERFDEVPTSAAYFLVRLAGTLTAQGDYAGSLEAWNKVLELVPESLGSVISRGACRLLLGDLVGAEEDFRRALAVVGEDCDILNQIAIAYDNAGDSVQALAYYERAYAALPNPLYRYNMAVAHVNLFDYETAQQVLLLALGEAPDNADWLNLAGDLAYDMDNKANALELYRKAAEKKHSLYHQYDLAMLLSELGDREDEAAAAWDALVTDYAEYTDAWLERGWYYYENNRLEEAIADYKVALELVPENEEGENRWAICLEKMGDVEGALEHYKRSIELNASPTLYANVVALLEEYPEYEAELELIWHDWLEQFPDHPKTLLANGDRLKASGSLRAAAESYARGAEINPWDPKFPNREGNCLWSLGEYGSAVPLYETSLALAYDPIVVSNLAGAYKKMGMKAKEALVWEGYLAEFPEDPELVMQYGLALFEDEMYEQALEQYKQGQRLEPDNDLFYNRAALCLFNLGEFAQGVEMVEKALALREDPLYYGNLAFGYEELGDVERAGQYYRQGLKEFPDDYDLLEDYTDFLLSSGDDSAALDQLKAFAGQAQSIDVYLRLAELAEDQLEYALAEQSYSSAVELAPDQGWPALSYALYLARMKSEYELLNLIASVHGSLSTEDFAWIVDELGAYWLDTEQYQTGARMMEKLIEYNPGEPTAYAGLALTLAFDGQVEEGLAAAKRGLAQTEDRYFLSYLEAWLTQIAEGPEAALELCESLIASPDVDEAGFTLYLGVLDELGYYYEQIPVGRQGMTKFPDSAAIFSYLVIALYLENESSQTIALLENPAYADLELLERSELLGLCYLDEGNYVKSVGYLAEAAEKEDAGAMVWSSLGEAQYFKGDIADAHKSLTTSLALDPDYSDAHLWLGYVLLTMDDLEGAELAFSAVETSPYSQPLTLAWMALGRARLALASGDLQNAALYLDEAEAYGISMLRFDSELAKTRRASGLTGGSW